MEQAIKIARTATSSSVLDVTENLDSYTYKETAKKKEDEYKGKIIFSITEFKTRKYKKAFIDKDEAKVLCHAIIHMQFDLIYAQAGFTDRGMGGYDNGSPIARTLTIKQQKNEKGIRFQITIDEAPGIKTETGAVKPKPGAKHESAMTFVSLADMLALAHEVYDYIKHKELVAMQSGKPLNTIMYFEKPAASQNIIDEEFEIPFGKLQGTKLGTLKNEQLKSILGSVSDHPIVTEIKQKAQSILQKRGFV